MPSKEILCRPQLVGSTELADRLPLAKLSEKPPTLILLSTGLATGIDVSETAVDIDGSFCRATGPTFATFGMAFRFCITREKTKSTMLTNKSNTKKERSYSQ